MSGALRHQLRVDVPERIGEKLRAAAGDPELAELGAILGRHAAEAVCQFDAFAGYCAEAERQGIDRFPLYH